MPPIFQMFANYNGWADAGLYAAAAQLPDAEYRARNSMAPSWSRCMARLMVFLVGDRIWMQRLTGEGDAPTRLDAILLRNWLTLVRPAAEGGIDTHR